VISYLKKRLKQELFCNNHLKMEEKERERVEREEGKKN